MRSIGFLVTFAVVAQLVAQDPPAAAPAAEAWRRASAGGFTHGSMSGWSAANPQWAAAHGRLLAWLAGRQDEAGRVAVGAASDAPADADVAATALAMLAFGSGGSTMRQGPHKEPIKKAAIWLKGRQREDGWFVASDHRDAPLVQALAAAAMTQVAVDSQYRLLEETAAKGLRALGPLQLPERAGSEPVALALAVLGARRFAATGRSELADAVPRLAQQLRADGVAANPPGAFAHDGPAAAAPELASLALAIACRDTPALPGDSAALLRLRERFAALPARFGGNGELLDGLVLLLACDLAADLGGEPWRTMQWQVEHRVLPRLAPAGGSIAFACGATVLRNETAESALVALALAVPWYRVGR
jgi:hypothetical protein